METGLVTKRILKRENDNLTNKEGEVIVSKLYIDFNKIQDYEEYVGELTQIQHKYSKYKMTIVLIEHETSQEWKVILIDFDDFHNKMEKFRKDCENRDNNLNNIINN